MEQVEKPARKKPGFSLNAIGYFFGTLVSGTLLILFLLLFFPPTPVFSFVFVSGLLTFSFLRSRGLGRKASIKHAISLPAYVFGIIALLAVLGVFLLIFLKGFAILSSLGPY
jgi:hypothetical protein